MKKFLTLFLFSLSLNSFSFPSDVYYCSEILNTVIDSKTMEIKKFPKDKFTMKVDFENMKITSPGIYFLESVPQTCIIEQKDKTINCITSGGRSISFNPSSRSYRLSSGVIDRIGFSIDPIILSIGYCEKFD